MLMLLMLLIKIVVKITAAPRRASPEPSPASHQSCAHQPPPPCLRRTQETCQEKPNNVFMKRHSFGIKS